MASDSDREPAGTPAEAGTTVVITGAASELGRRVCARTLADPDVARVVAIDQRSLRRLPAGVERHQVDLADADLKPLFEGAAAVVHLAQADGPAPGSTRRPAAGDELLTRRVLDAASAVGTAHLVVLSSALSLIHI